MTKKMARLLKERQELLRSLAEETGARVERSLLPEYQPRPAMFSPEARKRRAREAAARVQ